MRGTGLPQATRWLRRVARALRGAGCVLLVPVRLATVGGRCGWRLTGFEVSVGWIDPSTPSLNLNATGTRVVMDAEMGLSLFEVMVIEEDGWVVYSCARGKFGGVTSGRKVKLTEALHTRRCPARRLRLKARRHLDVDAEHARRAARPDERRGGRAGRRGLAARGRTRLPLRLRLRLRGVVEHHARARSLPLVGGAAAVPG